MPRERDGIYWGYGVRIANSLAEVFTAAPFKVVFKIDRLCIIESKYWISLQGGYDLVVGTSERGESVDKMVALPTFKWEPFANFSLKQHLICVLCFFSHALLLFGGVQGLEYSLECDEKLKADNVADLCDLYLNLCPDQGSRTIRTEVEKVT